MTNQTNQGFNTSVTTDRVRLSYVHLFQPYANQPGQEPKYSTTILIPKSDTATMQRVNAAIEAAIQKGVATAWSGARPPQPAIPIWDGDGVRKNGDPFGPECKGHWVLTASSKQLQSVVDLQMNPIIDQTQVYSGMFARVHLNFFPYANSGNRGVGAGLGPVQKVSDGEPLGGKISAEQAFGGSPAPAAPAYSQPPAQAGYGYAPPAGQTQYQQPPAQAGYGYAPPAGQQQYQQPPAGQPQIDPITGKPMSGGIWGL